MLFHKSTPEEVAEAKRLVADTTQTMTTLTNAGHHVHIIWDFDFVLSDGISDDAFAILGYNVDAFFAFEERLLFTTPLLGLWAEVAMHNEQTHATQDIVTARSSLLAMRMMQFILNNNLDMRWQLMVGHQSKKQSYAIILDSFQTNPLTHVFMVDDTEKHVASFNELAKEKQMDDRCHGIVSPKIRKYNESELREFVTEVMKERMAVETLQGPGDLLYCRREVYPSDAAVGRLKSSLYRCQIQGHKEGVVSALREPLEEFLKENGQPGPYTLDTLYMAYEMLKSP